MRLAVISDIHGNLAALEAVLDDIEGQHVDRVVNLGDILSGPLQPAETADLLMARDFVTIAGNHERRLLRIRDGMREKADDVTSDAYTAARISSAHVQWLRGLPAQHWLQPDILLVHGTPASDLAYWLETVAPDTTRPGIGHVRLASGDEVRERLGAANGASLVLCGHTHLPRIARVGTTLIVNPGSVGLQAYEAVYPHPHCMETGSPHARYAVVERRGGQWSARSRTVTYAWNAQARLAAARGRSDWASALATGHVPPVATRSAL